MKIGKFLALVAGIVLLGLLYQYLTSDEKENRKYRIKGKVIDASYANIDGNEIVWLLSKPSKAYSNDKKTIKEKIWLNKYLLNEKKIVKRIELKLNFNPYAMRMIQYGRKLFIVSNIAEDRFYYVANIITGDTLETLKQLKDRSPKFSAGVASLQYVDQGNIFNSYFNILSRDGYSMIYSIVYDSLFNERADLDKLLKEDIVEFELIPEDNAGSYDRKLLCKKKWEDIYYESTRFEQDENGKWLQVKEIRNTGNKREIKTVLDPNWIFLKGEILYQDMQYAVVLHEAGLGMEEEDCQRFLTCMDTTGNVLWKINAVEEISESIKRSKESMSDMFFIKDKFKIKRSGDVFTILYNSESQIVYIMNCVTGDKIAKRRF